MPKGKWARVDRHLRIAVGLELPELPAGVTVGEGGVADVRPNPKQGSQEVYLDMRGNYSPAKIELKVPAGLEAPWGWIVFNDNKKGAGFLLGRQGERGPFDPDSKGGYVSLRLDRVENIPFNPVYVKISEGEKSRFLLIRARWKGDTITIEIEPVLQERVPRLS